MKIVLITRDRPELTAQTIETMKANAANWNKHSLVAIFDGTAEEWANFKGLRDAPRFGFFTGEQIGVGGAKNLGAIQSPDLDPEDILMFSDNDMYYLPNWDKRLEESLEECKAVIQLGGWRHPYHDYIDRGKGVLEVDAVTGNCFVIKYKDWLTYGPFDANALGPGQSEDFALSRKIVEAGGVIATLDPPVAIHCGLANCEGKPATGWEEMAIMAEKQLEANDIKSIWLEVPDEGTIKLERASTFASFTGLNVGSGQRSFAVSKGWTNVDCVSRPPDQVPDVVCDANKLTEKFPENSQDMVVLHHVIEHFGCGEADEVLKQCFKVLKPGGSLLVFVPDLRKLAGRWLSGELDDFSFMVNVYGAYQGLDGDRHKWGFDASTLYKYLMTIPGTGKVKMFDWREIPGADIAKDWYIVGMEVVKA